MTLSDYGVYFFSKVWAAILLLGFNILGSGKIYKYHPCGLCGSNGPDHFPGCQYVELQRYVRHG